MTLLEINDLSIEYGLENGSLEAVEGASLSVEPDSIIGLVGESGCGKTTVAKSILGLLDSNARITGGEILFEGRDLTEISDKDLRQEIRWQQISYIPQNAMAALDPVYRVGSQIVEAIRTHRDVSKEKARERTRELLREVDLDEDRMYDYPHQLSGGQRQRVVIALALALEPKLIIADEPTTGLDVIVQDAIIDLLYEIQSETNCSIIMVTHDMSVVGELTDFVTVMYGGWVMESGRTEDVFTESANPYTIGLKNAFPTLTKYPDQASLVSIPGAPPALDPPPDGCRFAERCPFATAECTAAEPPLVGLDSGQRTKCHFPDQIEEFRIEGKQPELWRSST